MIEAENLYQDGIAALKANRHAEAQQLLRQSLAINPRNADGWLYLAQTTDDRQRQLKCVENALKANPTHPRALQLQRALQTASDDFSPEPVSASRPPATAAPSRQMTTSTSTTAVVDSRTNGAKSADKLGRLLTAVGVNRGWLVWRIIQTAVLLFLGGLALYHGINPRRPQDQLPLLLLGSLLAGMGLVLLSILIMVIGYRIALYEDGIVRFRRGKPQVYRWSDFSDLTLQNATFSYRYMGIPVYHLTMYKLALYQDGRVVLRITPSLAKFRQVGDAIMNFTTPPMLKKSVTRLRNGETLQFGEIKATRLGISRGRNTLEWRHVRDWQLNNGTIHIYDGNRQVMRHSLSRLKNLHVFVALCEQFGGRGFPT